MLEIASDLRFEDALDSKWQAFKDGRLPETPKPKHMAPKPPRLTRRQKALGMFGLVAGVGLPLGLADSKADILGDLPRAIPLEQRVDEVFETKNKKFEAATEQERFEMEFVNGLSVEVTLRTSGNGLLGRNHETVTKEFAFGDTCLKDTTYNPEHGGRLIFDAIASDVFTVVPANDELPYVVIREVEATDTYPAYVMPFEVDDARILAMAGCDVEQYGFGLPIYEPPIYPGPGFEIEYSAISGKVS